jgi:hypothetical protein
MVAVWAQTVALHAKSNVAHPTLTSLRIDPLIMCFIMISFHAPALLQSNSINLQSSYGKANDDFDLDRRILFKNIYLPNE